MTKREICERLINIHNRLFHEYAMADGMEDIDVEAIGKDIGSLILDLAAPETEEEPKAEEKHPGVIARPGKDGEIEWCWCQKCYGAADVVHDPFGDGEDWSYCKKCGVSFRLKRKEEEKEPPLLLYEEDGEKTPCPVCGAPAAPIKNKPGLFRCKRCQGLVCAKEGEEK